VTNIGRRLFRGLGRVDGINLPLTRHDIDRLLDGKTVTCEIPDANDPDRIVALVFVRLAVDAEEVKAK